MSTQSYSARLTSELYYLCSGIKVKASGVVMQKALTWISCTMTTLSQDERRTRVHLILINTSIHHHGFSLDFPTRKQSKALTLILRFLEYQFELSNNQVKVSK